MRQMRPLIVLVVLLFVSALFGCGDGTTTPDRTTTTVPPPPPSADVQVSGDGFIIIHPSIDPTYCCATEFPMQIQETDGGSAIWNFFRVSYFRRGVEVERAEQGATDIREAGFRDINSNSTTEASLIIRDNAIDFDDVELLLGFIDKNDGRQFQRRLDLASFDGVLLNFTPALIPEGSSFAIVEK